MYNYIKIILILLFVLSQIGLVEANEKISQEKAQELLDNQTIQFIENKGQITDNYGNTRSDIKYYIKGAGMDMYFRNDGVSYVLHQKQQQNDGSINASLYRVDLKFNESKSELDIRPMDKNISTYSYFKENENQIKEASSFSKLVYKDVYKGIDFVYYPAGERIKYDIVVSPGADPKDIKLVYEGQTSIEQIENDAVKVNTSIGSITESMPTTYQMLNNMRKEISTDYKVSDNSISFEIDDYDKSKELIIDPLINWTKFAGGDGEEMIGRFPNFIYNNISSPNTLNFAGGGVVSNSQDTIYITGSTNSTDFPFTSGINIHTNTDWDIFIQSYDVDGTLYHSHYVGHSNDDFSTDIDINRHGRPIIVGSTASSNIYRTSGLQGYYSGQNGAFDIYVYEYDLISNITARCVGGTDYDFGRSIDIDDDSPYDIYIIGDTKSNDFEMVNCSDCFLTGTSEAVVIKLDSNMNTVWTTYFGGENDEMGMGIDYRYGEVAIVGVTNSEYGFPLTNQPCYTGAEVKFNYLNNTLAYDINKTDGFVARLSSTNNTVLYADYKGGKDDDYLTDVVSFSNTYSSVMPCQDNTIASNNLIMVGYTKSGNPTDSLLWMPYKNYTVYDRGGTSDKGDGWIIRQDHFNLILSEYFAGSGEDILTDIELSSDNQSIIVAGYSNSEDVRHIHAEQTKLNQGNSSGDFDGIIASYDLELEPKFTTYHGSSNDDYGVGAAFNTVDMPFLLGETYQSTSPTLQFTELDNTYSGGGSDAFLTEFKAVDDNESTLLPTYFGGEKDDEIKDIATDYYDNFYITGYTKSNQTTDGFPATTGAYDVTYSSNKDVFVTKFNRLGRHLWTTYLGGNGNDVGMVIKVENDFILRDANVYVAGTTTTSTGLSVGDSSEYTGMYGSEGGFLASFSNDGSDLIALTYLYTSDKVVPYGIDLTDEHVYVCGLFTVVEDTWASPFRMCNVAYNSDFQKWNYNSIYCSEDTIDHNIRVGYESEEYIGFVTQWDLDLSLDWGNWIANDTNSTTIAYDVSVLDEEGWIALVGVSSGADKLMPSQWLNNSIDCQNCEDNIVGDSIGWVMVIKDDGFTQHAAWGTLIEGEYNGSLANIEDVVNNVEWLEQPGADYDFIIGGHTQADNEAFHNFSPYVVEGIDEPTLNKFDIFTMRFDIHPTDDDVWLGTRVAFWGASEDDYLVDLYSHELMDTIALVGKTKSTDQNYDVDFTDYYSIDEDNDNYAKYHPMILITDPNFNYIKGTFIGDEDFGIETVISYTAQDVVPTGLIIQDDGEIIITANTTTTDFGLSSDAFQKLNAGMLDGLIVRVNEDVRQLSKLSPYVSENLEAKSNFTFDLFPNPAVTYVSILNNNNLDISEINIYNATGKLVLQGIKSTQNIDVSWLVSGIYFIEIIHSDNRSVKSFIKN